MGLGRHIVRRTEKYRDAIVMALGRGHLCHMGVQITANISNSSLARQVMLLAQFALADAAGLFHLRVAHASPPLRRRSMSATGHNNAFPIFFGRMP